MKKIGGRQFLTLMENCPLLDNMKSEHIARTQDKEKGPMTSPIKKVTFAIMPTYFFSSSSSSMATFRAKLI